jgi:fatty acid desaturase
MSVEGSQHERTRPLVHDIPIGLKSSLADTSGVSYADFRATLEPRYARVWRDIALGWLVVAAVLVLVVVVAPTGWWGLPAAVAGGLVAGFTLAYLNNFFHEAAHFNLLPDRRWNDRATNAVIGWVFGSSIGTYRHVHFQHHRALGTTMDSENSYFDPLRIRYLVEGITGLKVLRTFRRYREAEQGGLTGTGANGAKTKSDRVQWLLIGALANLAVLALLLLWGGSWPAAVTWFGAVLVVFPFFVSLRQLLEHRAEDAVATIDYRYVDMGAVDRMFGVGPVASTLGSAGFNRHALHHWEPQISYTRLADLERYLNDTEMASMLDERRTTYARTFVRLLEL